MEYVLKVERTFGKQALRLERDYYPMQAKKYSLKAVAQAQPAHTMSCFLLPKSLFDEMTSMVQNFWWEQKGDERKTTWMKSDKV